MLEALLTCLTLTSGALPLLQDPTPPPEQTPAPAQSEARQGEPEAPPTYWSIDMFAGAGLSIGNSRRWNGLRINARDHGVETVNGVNLTVWAPAERAIEQMNGLALGFATRADDTRGVSLGLLAAMSNRRMGWLQLGGLAVVSEGVLEGLSVGGLAAVSEGDMTGINIGGLASVSEGDMTGFNFGGLATVAEGQLTGFNFGGLATVAEGGLTGANISGFATVTEGDLEGINIAGLATVAEGSMAGINLAGLATVTEGRMTGLNVSGLATVAEGKMTGINIAGLATVSEGRMTGLNLSGLATVCQGDLRGASLGGLVVSAGDADLWDLDATAWTDRGDQTATGLMVALYRVQAKHVSGMSVAGLVNRAHEFSGFGVGAYNAISGRQEGVTIGLFNHAENLSGLQIGLLNHVPSNPPWLRWLPLFNAPF